MKTSWEARLSDSLIQEEAYRNLTIEQQDEGFSGTLQFGTAGIRGLIGLGPNRLNKFTVQKVALGLAQYLKSETKSPKVVIGFDTRHLSPEFSDVIAKVLAHHEIKTYVFERYRTTPELSFAVRYLNADAGVMITASHNPPEYNGIKIYGSDGGQLALEPSEQVSKFIQSIDALSIDDSHDPSYIEVANSEVTDAYKRHVLDLVGTIEESSLNVVFSSLHGTSVPIVPELLDALNFKNYHLVKEQVIPDPNFTHVASANPEEHSAFDLSIKLAEEVNADLLIATDPDADRMGIVVKHLNDYHYFNGNQIGAILLYNRILQTEGLAHRAAVKSIVTSELGRVIAQAHDVEMFDVLTGFKFIAEKIATFETTNSHNYIFGYEESYGYMAKPFVRDKDAVQIVPLLIKIASELKNNNETLVDQLNLIYKTYGKYEEKLFAHTMTGKDGQVEIANIMETARTSEIKEIARMKVIKKEDFLTQQRTENGEVSKIELPSANVLKFYFDNGWIALRPSGTEPKIKLYVSLKTDDINAVSDEVNAYFFKK